MTPEARKAAGHDGDRLGAARLRKDDYGFAPRGRTVPKVDGVAAFLRLAGSAAVRRMAGETGLLRPGHLGMLLRVYPDRRSRTGDRKRHGAVLLLLSDHEMSVFAQGLDVAQHRPRVALDFVAERRVGGMDSLGAGMHMRQEREKQKLLRCVRVLQFQYVPCVVIADVHLLLSRFCT